MEMAQWRRRGSLNPRTQAAEKMCVHGDTGHSFEGKRVSLSQRVTRERHQEPEDGFLIDNPFTVRAHLRKAAWFTLDW